MSNPTPPRQSFKLDASPTPRNPWELMVSLGGLLVFLGIAAFILNFFSFSFDGDIAPPRSESASFLPIAATSTLVWCGGMLCYLIGRVGRCFAR